MPCCAHDMEIQYIIVLTLLKFNWFQQYSFIFPQCSRCVLQLFAKYVTVQLLHTVWTWHVFTHTKQGNMLSFSVTCYWWQYCWQNYCSQYHGIEISNILSLHVMRQCARTVHAVFNKYSTLHYVIKTLMLLLHFDWFCTVYVFIFRLSNFCFNHHIIPFSDV